jgi:hypothetical protein
MSISEYLNFKNICFRIIIHICIYVDIPFQIETIQPKNIYIHIYIQKYLYPLLAGFKIRIWSDNILFVCTPNLKCLLIYKLYPILLIISNLTRLTL